MNEPRKVSKIKKTSFFLCVFIFFAIVFYFFIGRLSLDGEIDFQFFADSLTYEEAYLSNDYNDIGSLVAVNSNYFGPITVLNIFGGNRVAILFFNIFLLVVSVLIIRRNSEYRWSLFLVLVFISPITFFSLMSVNKEIFSILCVSILFSWVKKRNVYYIVLAIVFSFFVRWQLTLFVFIVWFSFSRFNILRKFRALYLLVFLLAISIAFPLLSNSFSSLTDVARAGAMLNEGSGVYSIFNELQLKGLYFLVFIPKTLQAMYGLALKPQNLFSATDFYNNVVITTHCIVSFSFFLLLILKKKFKINDDIIYISIIYCLIFSLSPIYAPRYFYPVFIFVSMALSKKNLWVQDS